MKVVKTKTPMPWNGSNVLKGKTECRASTLFATFTELALFVFQACTQAPAPPITVPLWTSSPLPQTLPPSPPPPPTCPPDITDWTETSAALITCPHWRPWTAQETGESSADYGCVQPSTCDSDALDHWSYRGRTFLTILLRDSSGVNSDVWAQTFDSTVW